MTNCIIRTSLWKIPLLLFVILFRALYVECFVPFRQEISSISYNYISTQLSASAVSSKNTLAPDKPSPRDQNARRKTRILFQSAKQLEKQGKWREASDMYQHILQEDPRDSHSHLGYARLEARRDSKSLSSNTTARHAFLQGTMLCPDSVHLWQAWALYEQSCGDYERARTLLEQALTLDERNPYVCHAYGLMEKKLGNQHVSDETEVSINRMSRVRDTCTNEHSHLSSPKNFGNGPYWNVQQRPLFVLSENCLFQTIISQRHGLCTFNISYHYPPNEKKQNCIWQLLGWKRNTFMTWSAPRN